MSEQKDRTYPGMILRNPGYWQSLVAQVENFVASISEQIGRLPGLDVWHVDFQCISSPNPSPRIRLVGQKLSIEFPEGFFLWTDEAAMYMHGDVPYRSALSICQTRPEHDHSKLFHLLWDMWIVYHEISHFLCGHLFWLARKDFIEFDALSAEKRSPQERLIRQAMEVDADVLAAKFFFGHIARTSMKRYWDDLYSLDDARAFLMQDLALIFLPLFMELSYAESKDPRTSTHPAAIHRLVLFQLFGFNAYSDEVGADAPEHLGAYMAGLKKSIQLLIHMDDSMLHERMLETDFAAHKMALLEVEMQKRRMTSLDGDWLLSGNAAARQ